MKSNRRRTRAVGARAEGVLAAYEGRLIAQIALRRPSVPSGNMRKYLVILTLTIGMLAGAAPPADAALEDFPTSCPQMEDSIYRLYAAYFLREPDLGGWDYWTSTYGTGPNTNLEVVSDSFAISQEFINRYGNLSNEEFVRLLYRNVLDREPDQEGFDHWVGVLNSGYPRGAVMIAFSESIEFIRKTGTIEPQAGHLMWYDRSLHYDCGIGLGRAEQQPYSRVATPGLGATYVDILVWNLDEDPTDVSAILPGSMRVFDVFDLEQYEYLHVYNVPVPSSETFVDLLAERDDSLAWSVVFHDRPHSADRPGWDGVNWLGRPQAAQGGAALGTAVEAERKVPPANAFG